MAESFLQRMGRRPALLALLLQLLALCVVLLLHRALTEAQGDPSELSMWVAKNRHGIQPTIKLNFRGHYSSAEDYPGRLS